MKISVITPTCFRPQMFREMCMSLINTTQKYEIEHIVLIDEDNETLSIALGIWNHLLNRNQMRIRFCKKTMGALSSWNKGLELSTGNVIVPSSDDQLFYPDWLKYALENLETKLNGYGVVGMNDLAYSEEQVATMFLFTRDYCKDHMGGVIAPPEYD